MESKASRKSGGRSKATLCLRWKDKSLRGVGWEVGEKFGDANVDERHYKIGTRIKKGVFEWCIGYDALICSAPLLRVPGWFLFPLHYFDRIPKEISCLRTSSSMNDNITGQAVPIVRSYGPMDVSLQCVLAHKVLVMVGTSLLQRTWIRDGVAIGDGNYQSASRESPGLQEVLLGSSEVRSLGFSHQRLSRSSVSWSYRSGLSAFSKLGTDGDGRR